MHALFRIATRPRPVLSGLRGTNLGRAAYPTFGIRTLISEQLHAPLRVVQVKEWPHSETLFKGPRDNIV